MDLRELKLIGRYDGQCGTAGGFPDLIQGCTKLTRVELDGYFEDPEDALICSICSLVDLQHLVVQVDHPYTNWQMPAAAMPCFKHLTYLHFELLSIGSLVHLGTLTNLQELHFISDDDLADSPSSVPGLLFPTSLLTKLVLLSPVEAGLLSLVPIGLQDLTVDCDVEGPAEGPGSFLAYLARMQHLTRLSLEADNVVEWPAAAPAYSALTARSSLVELEFLDAYFAHGVWPHVFPASQKLPHLTSLVVWGSVNQDGLITPPPWVCSRPQQHCELLPQLESGYDEVHAAWAACV
jgi:hypothetical protein